MPLWKRNLLVCWFGTFATAAGMSLVVPFLPLFIEQLGIHETGAIERWSGLAFSATFLLSAIASPIWGRLADQKGRKLMLLRASLGMAIVMALMGFVQNIYELVGLRLIMGGVSGYVAAANALVATQVPKEHAGSALGTLSTGMVSGTLIGPLIGGWLAEQVGIRHVFYVTGSFIFLAFVVTLVFVREKFVTGERPQLSNREVWKMIAYPNLLISLFLTSLMLQVANMTIEPIVTVYVKQLLHNSAHVAVISGLVVSASGISTVFAAPRLGVISDRVGAQRVLMVCLCVSAILFIPQAFVKTPWQLMMLRFLMGASMAGTLPAVSSLLRQSVSRSIAGRVFGYNQSARYVGNIAGPLIGANITANFGFRYVFYFTSLLLVLNALWVYVLDKRSPAEPS
ncbi:multidrug efflux MFS transporter [Alicyclobacillus dauci]|uniref:Multidrug efflux MFS transporter n=1 Tax=Alicyclobacillus dauci TaxID=1475485 RepID=A0ABY6Z594_9BACL|nr:multidrug efflux MFS transporter [Alicyclobacillus dauci]WAH37982.1 multidrug efflux MFS transporter [Alicyclobacillus dauci]